MLKKLLLSLLFLSILVSGFGITSQAIEYQADGDVTVSEPATNLHLAGGTVNVTTDINKDLVIAGGNIDITGKVERNILVAGGTININSPEVGGTIRLAGGQIKLSDNYQDDVIVAGGVVTIENAQISGDLVVSSGKIIFKNSQVNGNFYGSYGELEGNLDETVVGDIKIVEKENWEKQRREN